MYVPKRLLAGGLAMLLLAAFATVAIGDRGRGGHGDRGRHGGGTLRSTLVPSVPADPALHGVTPGAAPWVLDRGSVRVDRRGRLRLRVRGLVIPNPPGDGTPGPVQTVSASLYCGADSETAAAGTTEAADIDRDGDARIRDDLDVPAKCLAPIVLVHPNGDTTHYIAASGLEG